MNIWEIFVLGSETYSPLCTKPDLYPYRDSLQHSNEITPLHHSIKRKISNGGPIDLANRRKQLKTHITHTLPISPNSNSDPVQSDEENVLTVSKNKNSMFVFQSMEVAHLSDPILSVGS